ncbi:MAG: hypothetical protein OXH31_08760, partial [Gammaproteobacteria bacterium]|nr:hypothetical protein [Gammaproteobacteria bacterium]
MTQEQHTESSSRNLIVGITFVIGSAIGVLAVIAIQGFLPKSEIASYDFNEMEVQQGSSKNFYRSANEQSVVPRKFEEIFKHRSPAKHYKALYNTLSHSTEQELKEWWTQTQKIERTSHREVAQQVVLRNLTEINPQEALQLLNDASTLQWDALSETIFSVWAAIHLDDAIEAAAKLERAKRNVALKAILRARDDLSDDKRRLIAVQLERVFTYERFVSEANALQSTTDPGKSWDTLLNDNVDDARQIAALAIVADQWREQIGFEVMSKIYHSGIEDYAIKRLLISAIAQADPALALKFVQGVSEETERSYMSQIIVEQWASTDPLAALGAVSSFKPSSLYIELEGT